MPAIAKNTMRAVREEQILAPGVLDIIYAAPRGKDLEAAAPYRDELHAQSSLRYDSLGAERRLSRDDWQGVAHQDWWETWFRGRCAEQTIFKGCADKTSQRGDHCGARDSWWTGKVIRLKAALETPNKSHLSWEFNLI